MKSSPYVEHPVVHWRPEGQTRRVHRLVGESRLSIRIQGRPYSADMRTPGEERAQVAGFLLYEGIIASRRDIERLEFSNDAGDCMDVVLSEDCFRRFQRFLIERERNNGLAPRLSDDERIERAAAALPPLRKGVRVDIRQGLDALTRLEIHQTLRRETGATHATAVHDTDFRLLSIGEDVGRHNGMDKAIGRLLLEDRLAEAGILVLSSRISFELVQKAARARVPVVFSVSRPTALAVRAAMRIDMTLVCMSKEGGCFVFCGHRRLKL